MEMPRDGKGQPWHSAKIPSPHAGTRQRALGACATRSHEPTEQLEALVSALETERFKGDLRNVLTASCPFLADIDLMTATPSLFAEAFKDAVDAKEDVLRKCRTFYLHAAQAAEIPVGPRLGSPSPRGPAASVPRKRRRQSKVETATSVADQQAPSHDVRRVQEKALEYQLIDLVGEPDVDDKIKESIWALVQYLMARKMKMAAAPSRATAS